MCLATRSGLFSWTAGALMSLLQPDGSTVSMVYSFIYNRKSMSWLVLVFLWEYVCSRIIGWAEYLSSREVGYAAHCPGQLGLGDPWCTLISIQIHPCTQFLNLPELHRTYILPNIIIFLNIVGEIEFKIQNRNCRFFKYCFYNPAKLVMWLIRVMRCMQKTSVSW